MIKLITLLVGGVPAVIASLIAFMARKLGTVTVTVAAFVLMTAVFITCINSVLSSVLSLLDVPAWIANGVGLFIPADFTAVLASVVSSKICRSAYDLAMLKIKTIAAAN